MSKFLEWLNRWNTSVFWLNGERHRFDCELRDTNVILIDKADGKRIHESLRKYCPFCGAKLR